MSDSPNGVAPKGKEKTKSFAAVFPSLSQKTLAELEKLNKKLHLTIDTDEIADLCAVPETNFLFGGLNLIYAPDSYGKSWQLCVAVKNSLVTNFYLDTDGSNGKAFSDHCINNNTFYVGATAIETNKGSNLFEKTVTAINDIGETMKELKIVIIIDSLTSLIEGIGINNAEDISEPLYNLNRLAAKYDAALILIDHATENTKHLNGFKLEGNAGAKRRTTVTVNRYLPIDPKKPEKGGTFVCERARGNISDIAINSKHTVHSVTIKEALKFMLKKFPELKTKGITQTHFTETTKNKNTLWLREYRDRLFVIPRNNDGKQIKGEELTLKKEYLNQIKE